MAFVNEYISDEDVEKYGIAQLRDELHAYHQRRRRAFPINLEVVYHSC